MPRNYVGSDSVRFSKSGLCTVNMEVYGGETVKDLTPKRLFPMTGESQYITLLNSEGKEEAIIRDIETLMPESKQVILNALKEYYFIPQIQKICSITDKFGILNVDAETDKGRVQFSIKNRHYDIKKIYDNRILIRDRNDNRYEISDYTELDKKSIKMLYQYI